MLNTKTTAVSTNVAKAVIAILNISSPEGAPAMLKTLVPKPNGKKTSVA